MYKIKNKVSTGYKNDANANYYAIVGSWYSKLNCEFVIYTKSDQIYRLSIIYIYNIFVILFTFILIFLKLFITFNRWSLKNWNCSPEFKTSNW